MTQTGHMIFEATIVDLNDFSRVLVQRYFTQREDAQAYVTRWVKEMREEILAKDPTELADIEGRVFPCPVDTNAPPNNWPHR